MANSKHSPQLTPEYKLAIGDVIVSWSVLEAMVEELILKLLNTDRKYGGAAIRHLTTKSKIDLIVTIIKDKYGEESNEFTTIQPIMNRVSDTLTERNRIVHGYWFMWPDKSKTLRMVFKKGSLTEYADTPDIKHLQKTREEITELVIELAEASVCHGVPLPKDWPFEKPYKVYKEELAQNHNRDHVDEAPQGPPESSEE